jgi:hypothetical protein
MLNHKNHAFGGIIVLYAKRNKTFIMKKFISVLAVAIFFSSCDNDRKEAEAQQRTIDSMQQAMAAQKTIDSLKAVADAQQKAAAEKQAVANRRVGSGGGSTTHTTNNTYNTTSNPAPATKQRKGLSSTATGALIGAGVGAVTGAVVDKRRGEGAIIGGVAGAAVGAGTGAIIDNSKKKRADTSQRR